MRINKTICDYCEKEITPRITDRVEIENIGTFGISKYRVQGNGTTARAADLCLLCSANIAKLLWDSFRMEVEEEKKE